MTPEIYVEPPYPGALQDEMAWNLVKYVREDVRLEQDVSVEIGEGLATLDFRITSPEGKTVVVEMGQSRTNSDLLDWRDARLMSCSAVADTIYRISGNDVLHQTTDILWLMSQWDASLFSERGMVNLATLASPEVKRHAVTGRFAVTTAYPADDDSLARPSRALWMVANGQTPYVTVRRFSKDAPHVWQSLLPFPQTLTPQ